MSKIKTGGLDQSGAGPFEQQQFGTAGVEGVNLPHLPILPPPVTAKQRVVGRSARAGDKMAVEGNTLRKQKF